MCNKDFINVHRPGFRVIGLFVVIVVFKGTTVSYSRTNNNLDSTDWPTLKRLKVVKSTHKLEGHTLKGMQCNIYIYILIPWLNVVPAENVQRQNEIYRIYFTGIPQFA